MYFPFQVERGPRNNLLKGYNWIWENEEIENICVGWFPAKSLKTTQSGTSLCLEFLLDEEIIVFVLLATLGRFLFLKVNASSLTHRFLFFFLDSSSGVVQGSCDDRYWALALPINTFAQPIVLSLQTFIYVFFDYSWSITTRTTPTAWPHQTPWKEQVKKIYCKPREKEDIPSWTTRIGEFYEAHLIKYVLNFNKNMIPKGLEYNSKI